MRDARALFWLTVTVFRRLEREPQIVRSLLWPVALGPLTLMLTVLVWIWFEGDWPIAVDTTTPEPMVTALIEAGYTLDRVPDARHAAEQDGYRIATDGRTVFARGIRGRTLQVERVLREVADAPWAVAAPRPLTFTEGQGTRPAQVLGVLFALFGVVFGAGMVARDRDGGTLEAELSLGVGRWVHGTARWLAATALLMLHYLLAVAVIYALMGVSPLGPVVRNGAAACATSVALGLMVIGRGGLASGFSGPLATGLVLATAPVGLALTAPAVGQYLPIGSLVVESSGWVPLGASVLLTLAALVTFTIRSARS